MLPDTVGLPSTRYADRPEAVAPGYAALSVSVLLDNTCATPRRFVSISSTVPTPTWESNIVPDPVTRFDPWTTDTVPVSWLVVEAYGMVYPVQFVNEIQTFRVDRSVSTRMLYWRWVAAGLATSGKTIW